MSGDSAQLALGVGSAVYSGLQGASQARRVNQYAEARAEARAQQVEIQAMQIEAAAAAQAATLERQAQVRGIRADMLGERAELTRARLALRKAQEGRDARRRQGRRRTQFASRGITRRGTPTDVLADAAAGEALNLAILEFEGQTRAVQFERGAALREHEASLLSSEAGFAREAGRRKASFLRDRAGFIRSNAGASRVDPTMAGLSTGISTAVQSGIPEYIGGLLAGMNDPIRSEGTVEIEAGTGARSFVPRRRSRFKRSLLS